MKCLQVNKRLNHSGIQLIFIYSSRGKNLCTEESILYLHICYVYMFNILTYFIHKMFTNLAVVKRNKYSRRARWKFGTKQIEQTTKRKLTKNSSLIEEIEYEYSMKHNTVSSYWERYISNLMRLLLVKFNMIKTIDNNLHIKSCTHFKMRKEIMHEAYK